MSQSVRTPFLVILAIPAILFTPRAVAQSGANAVGAPAKAYTANSQAGRKTVAIIAGRAIYEDELLPLMEEQLQKEKKRSASVGIGSKPVRDEVHQPAVATCGSRILRRT